MNIPASRSAWIVALMPNTTIEPIHMLKMMHHIHAKTCITRWRVLVSGMWDRGLCRLSITKLYIFIIAFLRPRATSATIRSALNNGKSNANVKLIKKRAISPLPATPCPNVVQFTCHSRVAETHERNVRFNVSVLLATREVVILRSRSNPFIIL